ncbi:MAG TPA: hypothetical protein VI322_02180 [Candidatus Saccharimonadia bacterium]
MTTMQPPGQEPTTDASARTLRVSAFADIGLIVGEIVALLPQGLLFDLNEPTPDAHMGAELVPDRVALLEKAAVVSGTFVVDGSEQPGRFQAPLTNGKWDLKQAVLTLGEAALPDLPPMHPEAYPEVIHLAGLPDLSQLPAMLAGQTEDPFSIAVPHRRPLQLRPLAVARVQSDSGDYDVVVVTGRVVDEVTGHEHTFVLHVPLSDPADNGRLFLSTPRELRPTK